MVINHELNGTNLAVSLEGRLDTSTAPQLEKFINENTEGITELVFDFKELEYVSSAGLRVILSTQKRMNKQGDMIIQNVNDTIMEVFEMTGFADILKIE